MARMKTAKKASILITREKSTKVGLKETEMNKVLLFCSKLYKFVWVLFIFQWYNVQVSEFGQITISGEQGGNMGQ